MSVPYLPGQRWVSETEPELGLGSILRVTSHTVTVAFGAANESREYALGNAPIRRVRFHSGDSLHLRDSSTVTADSDVERRGLHQLIRELIPAADHLVGEHGEARLPVEPRRPGVGRGQHAAHQACEALQVGGRCGGVEQRFV
jgi:hypothetical protein